jgi:hypothetical protein
MSHSFVQAISRLRLRKIIQWKNIGSSAIRQVKVKDSLEKVLIAINKISSLSELGLRQFIIRPFLLFELGFIYKGFYYRVLACLPGSWFD